MSRFTEDKNQKLVYLLMNVLLCCWMTVHCVPLWWINQTNTLHTPVWTDQVISEGLLILHVLETVFTDPQLGLLPVIIRERREVPGIDLKIPDLDLIHVFHFGDLEGRKIQHTDWEEHHDLTKKISHNSHRLLRITELQRNKNPTVSRSPLHVPSPAPLWSGPSPHTSETRNVTTWD